MRQCAEAALFPDLGYRILERVRGNRVLEKQADDMAPITQRPLFPYYYLQTFALCSGAALKFACTLNGVVIGDAHYV
jgi:hypothetical protein